MSVWIRSGLHLPCSKTVRRWQEPIRHGSRPHIRKRNLDESFFHLIQPSARSHEFKFPVPVILRMKWEYPQYAPMLPLDMTVHDCRFRCGDATEHVTVIRLGIEGVDCRRGTPTNENQRTEHKNTQAHSLYAEHCIKPSRRWLILIGDNRSHSWPKSFDDIQNMLSTISLAMSESSQIEAAAQRQKRPAKSPGKK